jgi:integrase
MSSKFEDFLGSQHSLGKRSIKNYRDSQRKFLEFAKENFEDIYLDKEKVHRVLGLLSEDLSDSSWNLYVTLYKRYAKWLFDPEDEVCPNFWRKIKSIKIDWEMKLKDKWLTEEEFYRFLDVIDYPRDKAIFGVAVEGALRLGELVALKIRDTKKTSYGYDVTVSGKTGSSSFPVVLFAPLLTHWLNFHPFKNDSDAPLWIGTRGRHSMGKLGNNGVHWLIKKYAKRAGLPDISFHWLRHSKITWTAKNKKVRISDEMAKKMFRWGKNSTMFSRYTHLHGIDSKDTFLALAGVKTEEEEEGPSVLVSKKCLNCNEVNSAGMLYCGKCGFVLDEEEARKMIEQRKLQEAFMKLAMEKLQVDQELEELMKTQK